MLCNPAGAVIDALTLYSEIKGELTAKNTDAGIFDAILRIY